MQAEKRESTKLHLPTSFTASTIGTAFSPRTQSAKGQIGKPQNGADDSPRGERGDTANSSRQAEPEPAKKLISSDMQNSVTSSDGSGQKSGRKSKRDNVEKRGSFTNPNQTPYTSEVVMSVTSTKNLIAYAVFHLKHGKCTKYEKKDSKQCKNVNQIIDAFFLDRGISGKAENFIVRNREGNVLTELERGIPLVELKGASEKKPYLVVCAPDNDMINDFTKDVWDGKIDEVNASLEHPRISQIINMANSRGQSALFCAARQGNIQILEVLLNLAHIDINVQVSEHGGTPLHSASYNGICDAVAMLLAAGADTNLKNKLGLTAREEARGEAIDVYTVYEKGGIFALEKDYPAIKLLKCVAELDKAVSVKKGAKKKPKVRKLGSIQNQVDNRTSFQSKRARQLSADAIWTYYMHFGQRINIFDLSPIEIAQQITLLKFGLFSKVREYELAKAGFGKAEKKNLAPNAMGVIDFFNETTNWVSTEILREVDLVSRTRVFSFFTEVLQYLLKVNNIDGCFSVQMAFQTAAIHRLKSTFAGATAYQLQTIDKVVAFCAPDQNYSILRTMSDSHQLPGLPYFGMYLKDLIFINDGVKQEEKRVELVNNTMNEIKIYQSQPYNFKSHTVMQRLFKDVYSMSDSDRMKLSLLLEPKYPKNCTEAEAAEIRDSSKAKAVKFLRVLEIQEKKHYQEVLRKLNAFSLVDIIQETTPTISIKCKDGEVGIHQLVVQLRCPDCVLDPTRTFRKLSVQSFQEFVSYLYRDECTMDNMASVDELFVLWKITRKHKIDRLEKMIHIYAASSQTMFNVIDFGAAAMTRKNYSVWEQTAKTFKQTDVKSLEEHPRYTFVESEIKFQEDNGKLKEMANLPLPIVNSSTWIIDITKLMEGKLADTTIIVEDVFGEQELIFNVHRSIIDSQSQLLHNLPLGPSLPNVSRFAAKLLSSLGSRLGSDSDRSSKSEGITGSDGVSEDHSGYNVSTDGSTDARASAGSTSAPHSNTDTPLTGSGTLTASGTLTSSGFSVGYPLEDSTRGDLAKSALFRASLASTQSKPSITRKPSSLMHATEISPQADPEILHKPAVRIKSIVPLPIFLKMLTFLYTRRFPEKLSHTERFFLIASHKYYQFFNHENIANLLVQEIKSMGHNDLKDIIANIHQLNNYYAAQILARAISEHLRSIPQFEDTVVKAMLTQEAFLEVECKVHQALMDENASLKARMQEMQDELDSLRKK